MADPPRLRGLRGKSDRRPLKDFEEEGLVGLDDAGQRSGLVRRRRAEKPVTPAKGGRRMNAAEICGLRQASAFDHRLGVVDPEFPLAQARDRRFGQRVEGSPAALAAEPGEPVRPSPGDDLSPCAMRTTPTLHPLMAACSKQVRATAALRGPARSAVRGRIRLRPQPRASIRPVPFRQRLQGLPPLRRGQSRDAAKPSRKVFSLHRITPLISFSLTETNS